MPDSLAEIENTIKLSDDIEGVSSIFENKPLIGHKKLQILLQKLVQKNKLHHALLFAGQKGIGKASFAFRLAYNLLCCNYHSIFDKIDNVTTLQHMLEGNSNNFLYITRSYDHSSKKFKSAITIDEVRSIIKFLSHISVNQKKIVIIDSIDDLNSNAANCLLKILEEPPANSLFILISHSVQNILPTIISRTMRFHFNPLSEAEVFEALNDAIKQANFDEVRAKLASQNSYGSTREAALFYLSEENNIKQQLDKFFKNDLDINLLNIIGDRISNSANELQYEQLKKYLLSILANRAKYFVNNALLTKANSLSLLWNDIQNKFNKTEFYNIDKKLVIQNLLIEIYKNIKDEK